MASAVMPDTDWASSGNMQFEEYLDFSQATDFGDQMFISGLADDHLEQQQQGQDHMFDTVPMSSISPPETFVPCSMTGNSVDVSMGLGLGFGEWANDASAGASGGATTANFEMHHNHQSHSLESSNLQAPTSNHPNLGLGLGLGLGVGVEEAGSEMDVEIEMATPGGGMPSSNQQRCREQEQGQDHLQDLAQNGQQQHQEQQQQEELDIHQQHQHQQQPGMGGLSLSAAVSASDLLELERITLKSPHRPRIAMVSSSGDLSQQAKQDEDQSQYQYQYDQQQQLHQIQQQQQQNTYLQRVSPSMPGQDLLAVPISGLPARGGLSSNATVGAPTTTTTTTTTAKPLQTQETKPTSLPSSPSPPRAPTPKPEVEESITDRADREAAEMVLGSRPPRTLASAATPAPPTAPVAEPESPPEVEATAKPNAPAPRRNAVYVHCAMGKSRSVTVVCAYLMWKYPEYFGLSAVVALDPARKILRRRRGHDAMLDAIDWVRRGRDIADPNPGFREQLAMWWEMACPEDVESHPIYRKWAFRREVDASVACGMAPTILRFEDEEDAAALARLELAEDEDDLDLDADGNPRATGAAGTSAKPPQQPSLRCKMCRRTLVTTPFIVSTDHQNPFAPEGANPDVPCQHYFIEPLSWMRETLQAGELEGRLLCPNKRCTSAVGRYSWKGFRCSCSEWVTPAFSLQKSRVDEVKELPIGQRMRELGIRRPPRRQNL